MGASENSKKVSMSNGNCKVVRTQMKFRCFISIVVMSGAILFVFKAVNAAPAATTQTKPSKSTSITNTSVPKAATAKAEWEQKWQSVIAGAKKEGNLTIYGSELGAASGAVRSAVREK